MMRRALTILAAGTAALVLAAPASAAVGPSAAGVPATAAGGWGKAVEVRGTAALDRGGYAWFDSVSCVAVGSCAAGGFYAGGSGREQVFVVTEAKGRWGKAIELPGAAALNQGGEAGLYSVSCAAVGSCATGGYYTDESGHEQVFMVTEAKGRWGKAIEVPGTAVLNKGGDAGIGSVSCAAVGSCAAGGNYADGSGREQAFVVTEAKGRWGKAIEVPRTAALNKGAEAYISSVSCAAAGSCAAGGSYKDGSGREQAFVVTEAKGRWGKAIEVPGTAALNKGGNAGIESVSCAAVGSCAAGGDYIAGSGDRQVFVVTEAKGRWGTAIEVPGTAALNKGGAVGLNSVSCAAAGSCGAGGYYADESGHDQVFVVTEAKGRWGKAIEVPGTAALNQGGAASIYSVSCTAAGSCAAGGYYADESGHQQAFVVTEAKGRWRTAIEVTGTAALNQGGGAGVLSVSCTAAGYCAAAGRYANGSGDSQAFIVSKP
jgi:hypothetical protein